MTHATEWVALRAERDALAGEVARLREENNALKQTIHDELDVNLRLRAMGGARPDEDMTDFSVRVIGERDCLRSDVERITADGVGLSHWTNCLIAQRSELTELLRNAGRILREAPGLPLELMDAEHLTKWTDAISDLCVVLVDYISPKSTDDH